MTDSGADRVRLCAASAMDGRRVWEMLQEFPRVENGFHTPGHGLPIEEFGSFLKTLEQESLGFGLRPGFVAQTTYWAFDGDLPVGICKLRHTLTPALRITGGHIGYGIRPSQRGKGYGSGMLAQTLVEAAGMGIGKVLITVNESNRASARVAERNGGVLSNRRDGKLYYWITTP